MKGVGVGEGHIQTVVSFKKLISNFTASSEILDCSNEDVKTDPRAGAIAQLVECSPHMREALGLIPRTT